MVTLNHGLLDAHGPIEELMAGNDGIVYSMIIKGDEKSAQKNILDLPWVESVTTESNGMSTTLNVKVTDERQAEGELLQLVLADPRTFVTQFGRRKHNLEEIFLEIVGGDKSNDNHTLTEYGC